MGPGVRRDDDRELPYSPSFFLRWPSVRSRKALSFIKPAASHRRAEAFAK
jgi:hypothetical protein